MKRNKTYLFGSLLISFSILTLTLIMGLRSNDRNIVYVRSAELVNNYSGMVEARERFQSDRNEKQANIDAQAETLKHDLEAYDKERPDLSEAERNTRELEFDQRHRDLKRYAQEIGEQTGEQEDEMLEGVLNQINAFVEDYAQKQGYDLVLGTTRSGSILYGIDAMDITDEVLEAMNAHYTGSDE